MSLNEIEGVCLVASAVWFSVTAAKCHVLGVNEITCIVIYFKQLVITKEHEFPVSDQLLIQYCMVGDVNQLYAKAHVPVCASERTRARVWVCVCEHIRIAQNAFLHETHVYISGVPSYACVFISTSAFKYYRCSIQYLLIQYLSIMCLQSFTLALLFIKVNAPKVTILSST